MYVGTLSRPLRWKIPVGLQWQMELNGGQHSDCCCHPNYFLILEYARHRGYIIAKTIGSWGRTGACVMRYDLDILILHGMSRSIVDYLKELFASLGISASTVLDLPSRKLSQEKRVDYYIKQCGMPLILVTFDESEANTTKARPNVYDEIARCRRWKREDTLVLQQEKNGKLVELPSNVMGQMVTIHFEADKLHRVVPFILKEIRQRGLIFRTSQAEKTVEKGGILNDFLDKMDSLWDQEFDVAWNSLHRLDYDSERELALALDHFFQQYQRAFSALIRDQKNGDELRAVCDVAYLESVKWAARAWEYAADAKMKKADALAKKMEQSQRRSKHQDLYNHAASELRKAKRTMADLEKIKLLRSVIQSCEAYVIREERSLVGPLV